MNHLENLRLALRKWQEVPKDMVELNDWNTRTDCGTLHCFGGWLRKVARP